MARENINKQMARLLLILATILTFGCTASPSAQTDTIYIKPIFVFKDSSSLESFQRMYAGLVYDNISINATYNELGIVFEIDKSEMEIVSKSNWDMSAVFMSESKRAALLNISYKPGYLNVYIMEYNYPIEGLLNMNSVILGFTYVPSKKSDIGAAGFNHIFLAGNGQCSNVMAHEIGHYLGLVHHSSYDNLMFSSGSGYELTDDQKSIVSKTASKRLNFLRK